MAFVWRRLLLFLAVLPALATSDADGDGNRTVPCHADQAAVLLQLKKSFLFSSSTTRFPSWQDSTDCCRWEGVGCSGSTGRVVTLNLGCGLISPGLDPVIFNLTSLCFLDLSMNDFNGSFIVSGFSGYGMLAVGLERLAFLTHLNLSKSGFVGEIPIGIGKLENLISLDLSCNRLGGSVPNWIWGTWNNSLIYLNLSHNMFMGKIPTSLCRLPMLEVLDLAYNNFSGPITSCLLEIAGLRVLNLRENNFEGILPSNIASECALQKIDIHGNNIEGSLPRALSNCNKLEILDIGNNLMVDTFPSWLGELSNLYILILRSNQFYGSIDDVGNNKSREYFSSLQIIDLASNKFSGNLSSEWFRQLKSMMSKLNSTGHIVAHSTPPTSGGFYEYCIDTTLQEFTVTVCVTYERTLFTFGSIDFSNNRLEGAIPESVGELLSLLVLNMSHNAFTGKIPAQLCGLTRLESLDLSYNKLSAEIPQELADLTYLSRLNLSNNQLVGEIPQSGQFQTFDDSSFKGNLGLWRPPLSNPYDALPVPPSEDHLEKSSDDDSVIIAFVGLGFVVGFGAAILQAF